MDKVARCHCTTKCFQTRRHLVASYFSAGGHGGLQGTTPVTTSSPPSSAKSAWDQELLGTGATLLCGQGVCLSGRNPGATRGTDQLGASFGCAMVLSPFWEDFGSRSLGKGVWLPSSERSKIVALEGEQH